MITRTFQNLELSNLGMGAMRLPVIDGDDSRIDEAKTFRMVDQAMAAGVNYYDTAWGYHGGQSEIVLGRALARYPRERFCLADKFPGYDLHNMGKVEAIFEEQLRKCQVEYFDFYLFHNVCEMNIDAYLNDEKYRTYSYLMEQKRNGRIKHLGFSAHGSVEVIRRFLNAYGKDMEFCQLQLNYLDWESEWVQSRGCYEVAEKHGKQVIVMEPVKGGTLANLPEKAAQMFREKDPDHSVPSWAIRFAASLPNVMVVLSGMSSLDQMRDNLSYMKDFKPLTEEEKEICFLAAGIINGQITIPCTGCSYCTEGCPQNIAIPKYFSIYNEDMRENLEEKGWTVNYTNYNILASKFGKASDCIACGQCESVCPQHLPIIENLKDVAKHYEE